MKMKTADCEGCDRNSRIIRRSFYRFLKESEQMAAEEMRKVYEAETEVHETEEHEHTCRDCGMGYECRGIDHWNGCDSFTGQCGLCQLDEMTP
jgi:hypothetical protein